MYRVTGDLDYVCRRVQAIGGGAGRRKPGAERVDGGPIVGVNVEVGTSSAPVEQGLTPGARYQSAKRVDPSNRL